MTSRRSIIGLVLALLVVAGLVAPSPVAEAQQSNWQLTVLRPLVAGQSTIVNDVSETGIAVGRSGGTPVAWNASGTPFPLPLPQGALSGEATAVNDTGTVVGEVFGTTSRSGVAWRPDEIVPLGANLYPTAVNNAGGIVGAEIEGGQFAHGFAMVPGGEPTRLFEDDADRVMPRALTEWGFVVGDVHATEGVTQGRGWIGQASFMLHDDPSMFFEVADVLENGWVLINVGPPNTPFHAGLITGDGEIHSIFGTGRVVGINRYGVIVGSRDVSVPAGQPPTVGTMTVYGTTLDLETLLDRAPGASPDLGRPTGINNSFWVVGNTKINTVPNAVSQSWLLRPPGLPSTGKTAG